MIALLKSISKSIILIMALLPFISVVGGVVHFWDDLEFVMDTVNRESVEDFQIKMDALWSDYEERMGVE